MKGSKRVSAFVVLAVLGGLLATGTTASANHETAPLKVRVGSKLLGVPGESMRYLGAREISVHKGAEIEFTVTGEHTATLLPTDVSAQDWVDANYGPGKDIFPVQPDDEAGEYIDAFNEIDEPSDPTCGGAGEPVCKFDGTEVLNSGSIFGQGGEEEIQNFTFTVEIDANAGERVWIICLAHPHMRMKVNVVDNQTATTTQAQIDTAAASQLALDLDWAEATHNKMKARRTFRVDAQGNKVWDAWAGVDNHYASLQQFYPRKLVLKKGDKVRWRFDNLVYEQHTVSMPVPQMFRTFQFGHAECDPGAGPDTPAELTDPNDPFSEPVCPDGTTVEFEFDDFLKTTGDQVFRGLSDLEHSGVRGPNLVQPDFLGVQSYDVKFTKPSGERPYTYVCFLHENMAGKIVVR